MAITQVPSSSYQHAVLPAIYPWDSYNLTIALSQLYSIACQTGFTGTYDDFQLRYGTFVAAQDPQDIHELIDTYTGAYRITPQVGIEQVLRTENKVLNGDIIIEPIPEELLASDKDLYKGKYEVTPMAHFDQILRTKDTILQENVTVAAIPYTETSNNAGGYTVSIG